MQSYGVKVTKMSHKSNKKKVVFALRLFGATNSVLGKIKIYEVLYHFYCFWLDFY